MDLYDIMMKRRSVRVFKDQEIPEPLIEKLLDVANHAPSGGNIQPLSIILLRDLEGRKKLAQLAGGQPWVRNAPLSMIFCLDFYRIKKWAEMCQTEFQGEKATNHFFIAYADLMVAAQNVVILAESLGLGSVYIGSIQHEIDETRKFFEIPVYVLPMMVLSIGYPKSIPQGIPKLKKEVIVHHERYQKPEEDKIRQAFDEKYGTIDQNVEKYFERAFVEVLEADKQESLKNLVSCQPCNIGKSVVCFLHKQLRRIGYEEIHRDTCRRRTRSSWRTHFQGQAQITKNPRRADSTWVR